MEGFKKTFINDDQLPLVIEPLKPGSKKAFLKLLLTNKESIKKSIIQYGGILFRGFPLTNAVDFAESIRALGLGEFVDYIGGDSPRNKIYEEVYTSTEAPPSLKIPLHNELSFVKNYPKNIYFFCEVAPIEKGETILADSRKVFDKIDSSVKKRFATKGLRYVSCYYHKSLLMDLLNKVQPSHKSWTQVLETNSKEEAERKCKEHEFDFQWTKNDWIQISQTRPAIITHPETNEKVWFNQAHLFDFNPKLLGTWRYVGAKLFYFRKHTKLHEVYYGDSSPIARDDLYHVMDSLDTQTVAFPWQKGDFLVLDNVLTMHGRAPFKGARRVLAAMTST